MTYEQIKKKINDDYNSVLQSQVITSGGRHSIKTFYVTFSKALEELHTAVGPFICTKEQFIEYIEYLKDNVNPDVYDAIIDYCNKTLKLDIARK